MLSSASRISRDYALGGGGLPEGGGVGVLARQNTQISHGVNGGHFITTEEDVVMVFAWR